MSEQISIRGLLRDEIDKHPTYTDSTIANRVLESLGVPDRPRMLLLGIVGDVAANLRRDGVRQIERVAFPSSRRQLASEPIDTIAERKLVLSESFAVDGRRVPWGDATEADHEARIEWLVKFRNGVDATIERHRLALAEIRAHGVSCLNEIEAVLV